MSNPQLTLQTTNTATSTIAVAQKLLESISDYIDAGAWSSIHIICDQSVEPTARSIARQLGTEHITTINEAEKSKSFAGLESLCGSLSEQGADRHSLVINIGGGALCDLGGFAASVYMRGVVFVHVPTTLLAQVDASVGGKTAINAFGIKNVVGTFTQPSLVLIDPEVLLELPDNHLASGYAEILKHGLINNAKIWEELRQTSLEELKSDPEQLAQIIHQSCTIKHAIVTADEHEGGERKKLNFGHTVGHAIESLSHDTSTPYLHGEAIALGMVAEARLSDISASDVDQITATFEKYSLPTTLPDSYDTDDIVRKMKTDKKNHSGSIRLTLLESIGSSIYDQERPEKDIQEAISSLSS